MELYYNPDFGYIVCAQTTLRGSVARVALDPPEVLSPAASDLELGNAVWRSLERSRTAPPVSREEASKYHFWQVSGIKGFYSFSKQFLCLNVSLVGATLRILPLERDPDGGYACPVNYTYIDLPKDRPSEELGAAVRGVFFRKTLPEEDELRTFVTDWGSCVAYRRPSDAFLDAGDGHTDAYQVFRHADYPGNAIAFLDGDRYGVDFCQCSEEDVRGVWQIEYGPLVDFEFSRNASVIEALGRTAEKELDAYIFPDGDGTMEVLLEVDLRDTPEAVRRQSWEEFEAVMSSVQIEYFEDWSAPPPPQQAVPDKKSILPKKSKERVFLRVQLVLTCIAAAITFYPIYEAWDYMSFAGIAHCVLPPGAGPDRADRGGGPLFPDAVGGENGLCPGGLRGPDRLRPAVYLSGAD